MCKIQKTTVSGLESEQARVYIQVAGKMDPEPGDQHVIFSVLVSTKPVPPDVREISLPVLQVRALKEAIALLGRAEDAI